jgi:hypothetical protein
MIEQHRVQAYGVKVGFNKKIDKTDEIVEQCVSLLQRSREVFND